MSDQKKFELIAIGIYDRIFSENPEEKVSDCDAYELVGNLDQQKVRLALEKSLDFRVVYVFGIFARDLDIIKIGCRKILNIDNADIGAFYTKLIDFVPWTDQITDELSAILQALKN